MVCIRYFEFMADDPTWASGMDTIMKRGYNISCGNEEIEMCLFDTDSCCEDIRFQTYTLNQDGTICEDIPTDKVISWKLATRETLPECIRSKEWLNHDYYESGGIDKEAEFIAVELTLTSNNPTFVIISNKHNGCYSHRAHIISNQQGVILDTFV